jgi:hypothetical protein
MKLQERINLMARLGQYIMSDAELWLQTKELAHRENGWFTPDFIDLAAKNIASQFLQPQLLTNWAQSYSIAEVTETPKTVGLVMAGNIPLVGFHDMLCVFIAGHKVKIKTSSKDNRLITHLITVLQEWDETTKDYIVIAEQLKNCDAYIATGSNNSSRYFEFYFDKFPHIIRRNRTSVAILDGNETAEELSLLADDIQLFFGLGCRNITKIYVPKDYDFIPLLDALKKYDHYFEFHKYKHNYDFQLALLMMNNSFYMNNGSIVLSENASLFAPASRLNYEFYSDKDAVKTACNGNDDIQCVVGHGFIPFGQAQQPSLTDYADGVDTMHFLTRL